MAAAFGLDNFKSSEFGQQVGQILTDKENITGMRYLSEHGIPAVQAVGKRLDALGKPISDEDKKLIGRWVREIMEQYGWTTTKKARVAPGNLFSTGAVYEPRPD